MKKIIALFLVVVCAFSLTACTDTEPQARVAAEGFLTALTTGDFDGMKAYVDDISAIPESMNFSKIVENAAASMPEDSPYTEEFVALAQAFVDRIVGVMSYTINDVAATDNGYEYQVTLVLPDADFEAAAGDLSEDALNQLLTDLLLEGAISEEDSEEKIMEVLMPELMKMVKETYESVEIKEDSQEKAIVVSEKDGKWLVNAAETFVGE